MNRAEAALALDECKNCKFGVPTNKFPGPLYSGMIHLLGIPTEQLSLNYGTTEEEIRMLGQSHTREKAGIDSTLEGSDITEKNALLIALALYFGLFNGGYFTSKLGGCADCPNREKLLQAITK